MDLCNKNCIVMDFLPGVRLIDGILANYERQARKMGLSMESLVKMSTGEAVSPSFWQRVSMGTRYSASAVGDWVWAVSATGFNYSLGWILPKSLHLSYPPPSINKHNIMKTLLQVQGHQIFISRLFQGGEEEKLKTRRRKLNSFKSNSFLDPHLGNFILCPDGKIGLIDFGQVKEFSEEDVQNYATTLDLLDRKENDALVAHQIATGFQTVKNDPEVIYKTTVVLFDRDDRVATGGLNLQQFMEEMDKKDRTVKIPENFVFAVRASILLRGIAGLLGIEGVSMVNEWRYYFRKVIAGNGRV